MKTLALITALAGAAFATSSSPIVQVRDIANGPTVAIVGWDANQAEFGLRTRLRRDGSHLGEGRAGEHRLFINTTFVESNGGFQHAVAHTGKLLRSTANARKMDNLPTAKILDDFTIFQDEDACRFDNVCSPRKTVGIGVSDEFLRENRDSLVVTLRPKTGRKWEVRFDKALIDAYLGTIDSTSAALKAASGK